VSLPATTFNGLQTIALLFLLSQALSFPLFCSVSDAVAFRVSFCDIDSRKEIERERKEGEGEKQEKREEKILLLVSERVRGSRAVMRREAPVSWSSQYSEERGVYLSLVSLLIVVW